MSCRTVVVFAAILVAIAFGAGYLWRATEPYHPRIVQADCMLSGDGDGTCMTDGTAYGVESSVPWTDALGSIHDGGTPECLPLLTEVRGVRVAADTVWFDGWGTAIVLWVDCRGQQGGGSADSPRSPEPPAAGR